MNDRRGARLGTLRTFAGSLRGRFSIVFGALALVPLLLVAVVIGRWTFGNLASHAVSDLSEVAASVGTQLEKTLLERTAELTLLDEVVGIGSLGLAEQEATLRALISSQSMYEEIAIVGSSDQERARVSAHSVVLPTELADHTANPLYSAAVADGDLQIGRVEFDRELREPIMTLAYPLLDRRSGKTELVLLATITFRPMWDLLANLDLTDNRNVYVVSGESRVVAHRDPTVVLRATEIETPDPTTSGTGLFGDDVVIGTYTALLGKASLTVVAEQPRADALGLASQALRAAYLVGALALLAVAAAVWIVARRVVRPIEDLAHSAELVASGDLAHQVSSDGPGEIGHLAEAFNQMTSRLKATFRSLEDRVEQRTAELQDALDAKGKLIAQLEAGAAEMEIVQKQLESLMKSKDQFLGSISHELRTPLTSVLGYAEMLADEAAGLDESEVDEMLARIAAEASDMADIIDDLLVAARDEGGTLSINPEAVPVRESVERVVAHLAHADVRVNTIHDATALADPVRLRQILRNLMVNAVRYGGEEVAVIVASETDSVVLEVRDNGDGVPKAQWEAIFQPYRRSETSTLSPASVGLGLSVSRTLARRMEGDLTYRYEDGTSIFTLELPAFQGSDSELLRAG